MKTLKFENELVRLILSGKKNTTWRLFDDKNLNVGDELILINSSDNKEFSKAKIISINEKKLKDIKEGDYDGHEKYKDVSELLETFKKYYGEKINIKTLVKIIKFKLL